MRWVVTLLAITGGVLSTYALAAPERCTAGSCPSGWFVPLLGVGYFALVAWLGGLNFPVYRLRGLCLAGAVASIGLILVLIVRRQPCTTCLWVHVTNFVLLMTVLAGRRPRAVRADPVKPLVALGLAVLTTIAIAIGAHWRNARAADGALGNADAATMLNWFGQRPQHRELLDPSGHTLVMFTDLTCEICQKVDEMLHERTLPEWDGKVRLIYKHYPICTDCNPGLPRNAHPAACDAAYLAEAARALRGEAGFDAVKSAIPAGLEKVTPALVTSVAATLRVGAGDLVRGMRSAGVKDVIAKDVRLGDEVKVDGTPTLFLDGREVMWTELGNDGFVKAWSERNP